MFQFPNDPQPGDTYKSGVGYYVYDGQVWRKVAVEPETFVELTGDTMSGALVLPASPPATPYTAAHKDYVDVAIAAASLYQGVWSVAANTPDLDPAVATPQHSYSWIATCANPLIAEMAPATLPGIGGQMIAEADNVIWNGNTLAYELVRTPGSVTGFLPLSGGVISGDLEVQGATKLVGTTMSGRLNMQTGHPAIELMQGVGGKQSMTLSPSSGEHSGLIEFFDPADGTTRRGYIGYGTATNLNLAAENGKWNVKGGFLMEEGAGIHWGGTSAQTDPLLMNEGICLYGWGGTSKFGFSITSGTLNYVVENTGNQHCFRVGSEAVMTVKNDGVRIPGGNLNVTGQISNGALHIRCTQVEGYGIEFFGGAILYKRSGHSLVFRMQASNTPIRIENNDGSNIVNIATTAMTALVEDQITERVAPLLAAIKELKAEIAALKGGPKAPPPPPTRAPPPAPRRRV